jgi:LacI family transcriptional regulator
MGRPNQRITVADVARAASVSPATAARALGEYGSVSPAARERVVRAADELGYRANAMARSMITGRTQSIGVVIADIEDQFFASLTRGISDVALEADFAVLVANTDERPDLEARAIEVFLEKQVDGILLAPSSIIHTDHLVGLAHTGTPVVLVDRAMDGLGLDSVRVDARRAARELSDHLLGLGHRRIAFISGGEVEPMYVERESSRPTRAISTEIDRYRGLVDAIEARGLTTDPSLVFIGGFHEDGARIQAERVLALDDPPTAIFPSGNLIALGVVQALNRAGVRVPDQMSVASFDDFGWQSAVTPPLTVVAQPVHEVGATAMRRLLDRIRGDESPPQVVELRAELIVRGSTGPPRRHPIVN